MSQLNFNDLEPNDLLMFGRQRLAEGDKQTGRRALETVIRKEPNHAQAFALLASLSYQDGADYQAEAYLDRAITIMRATAERRKRDMPTRASLANFLMARGETREAESLLSGVDLAINPIRATQREFDERITAARSRGLPSILINTVPKSASETIWNRLAEGLGLAQGHISLCLYPDCTVLPSRARFAAGGGMIAKEHLPASAHNISALADSGFEHVIFHLRDPRQVILSWAHFVRDDVSMRLMAPIWRKVVPPAEVLAGDLAGVLDWCVDKFLPQLIEFVQGWQDVAADSEAPIKLKFLTFETFLDKQEAYFDDALSFLGIDPGLFDARAEAETVHLRKGESEEWREVLTRDQKARAWKAIPADMASEFDWRK